MKDHEQISNKGQTQLPVSVASSEPRPAVTEAAGRDYHQLPANCDDEFDINGTTTFQVSDYSSVSKAKNFRVYHRAAVSKNSSSHDSEAGPRDSARGPKEAPGGPIGSVKYVTKPST